MVKIIEQSYDILDLDGIIMLKKVEYAARTCYKSEDKITNTSYLNFIKMLMSHEPKHLAMLEHAGTVSVRIVCNRGLSHELVRHRLASYAQESTRYCDYTKEKHHKELTVIKPLWIKETAEQLTKIAEIYKIGKKNIILSGPVSYWLNAMLDAEDTYFKLRQYIEPQNARGVLPIDIKTEIVITANLTEWRHIFKLRINNAHPQIMAIMRGILKDFNRAFPVVFEDIYTTMEE